MSEQNVQITSALSRTRERPKIIAPTKWWSTTTPRARSFYALRLHEGGFIQLNPSKLMADHTNWRFLGELKRELNA